MIKFIEITDKLNYPPSIKGKLSTLHASIITYSIEHFENVGAFKSKVISILNTISYYIINNDSLPSDWSSNHPFDNIEIHDQTACEDLLGELFLKVRTISWGGIDEKYSNISSVKSTVDKPVTYKPKSIKAVDAPQKKVVPTPKEHLYIRPPEVPQFDISKPWLSQTVNNIQYVIYSSIPDIPVIQNQISITTDINKMAVSDFMKLYPNCHIKTRPPVMYELHDGLTFDSDLGLIIPITGFSPKQIRDNIIRYPNWFKLLRLVEGNFVNFYQHIEINGELHDIIKIWDTLPESRKMPKTSEFIKEYVVRRYLLERDLKGIVHKYPIFGTFEPFLILFTSADEYKRLGYKDVADYAKQCVTSRVSYKQSRSPIIRQCMEVGPNG